MFDEELLALAAMAVRDFAKAGKTITCAESCTGGLIGACITSASGSSAVFERGFITYSNQARMDLLGVKRETLKEHGAVSAECASQMAIGARAAAGANAAVAVTGIAGPGGGSTDKPVGLVYIAVATEQDEGAFVEGFEFGDIGRNEVRAATVREAIEMLLGYSIDEDEEENTVS